MTQKGVVNKPQRGIYQLTDHYLRHKGHKEAGKPSQDQGSKSLQAKTTEHKESKDSNNKSDSDVSSQEYEEE